MVRGQVATITSGQGQLLTTLSREEKESLAILNPNDGVIYIRLNGPANITPTQWDWKLPSQSYGQYPGPWQSIGLFYQDLSGSNAPGQINLYESDAQLAIPSIVAIGRAALVAGTQQDITQGTIPQNPPANTIRMWMDGSGHLHLLDSSGNDKVVVDSSNINNYVGPIIAATALGGDLTGTIPNGHVSVLAGSYITMADTTDIRWGSGTNQKIQHWNNGNFYLDNFNASWIWRDTNRALASTMTLDTVGNLTISGSLNLSANQWVFYAPNNGIISDGNSIYIRSNGNPAVYIQNTSGSLANLTCATLVNIGQLSWNDGSYMFPSGGYVYIRGNSQGLVVQTTGGSPGTVNSGPITTNGNSISSGNINCASISGTGAVDFSSWIRSQSGQLYMGTDGVRIDRGSGQLDYLAQNGGVNHRFFHADGSWCGTQAANFQVQSSVEHARLYDKPVQPITDAISKVSAIDPLYYYHMDHIAADTDTPIDDEGHYTYGFSAVDVAAVMPEVASASEHMIDYNRMLPVLWQAVRDLIGAKY